MTLLEADEPPAFRVEKPHGQSPYFLTCDHASSRIPRNLGSLGVAAEDLQRHIAWDIGAAGVAVKLADALDAFAILSGYSRLVIDCNRRPGTPDSIVLKSEATRIPANEVSSVEEATARAQARFPPYHDLIRTELDTRQSRHRPTGLITV